MKSEVLSVKEKIGYGMGDAASHIIFDNVMLYMMFFYTDIFGIPAGFVGTMFLVARALDAISDPCMGLLADRTRSRWGKFRPWVLFGALPFGIVCVLAYSTPDLSMNGKMIYAAITYTLLTLLYTIVNIPYCALGGVITNDPVSYTHLSGAGAGRVLGDVGVADHASGTAAYGAEGAVGDLRRGFYCAGDCRAVGQFFRRAYRLAQCL